MRNSTLRISFAIAVTVSTSISGMQQRPPDAAPKIVALPQKPKPAQPPQKRIQETVQIAVDMPNPGNGILVGTPKIYDSQALQTLLLATKTRLAQINGFDSASLLQRLGTVQGADVNQTQVGLQASGPAPSTATATIPATPAPPTFTLPSTFGVSSLDLLNEQTQLNFELINLQLLLGGSLTDDFVADRRLIRRKVTIGFPITLTPPMGFDYRNSVAEVEISLCNPVESPDRNTPPTLVTLLPRERTYNVANVVSHASSIGTGAVAGIVNLGGSFMHGHQTLYLVRDQDTVALQRESKGVCTSTVRYSDGKLDDLTSGQVTFAWQFRPVLGRQVLTTGTRETFAQVSVPPGAGACPQQAIIRTLWRRYDSSTGRAAETVPGSAATTWITLPGYDMAPRSTKIAVIDNGDGKLTVRAGGLFTSSVRVKVGTTIFDETTPGFERSPSQIQFVAQAADMAAKGVYLIDRDGHEEPLVVRDDSSPESLCLVEQQSVTTGPAHQVPILGDANRITIAPTTSTTSSVNVTLPGPVSESAVPLVMLGSRVFGLRDAPFDSFDAGKGVLSLRVPTQLLRSNRELAFIPLLADTPPIVFPIGSDASATTIGPLTLLASDSTAGNTYLLTGANLEGVAITFPGPIALSVDSSKTTATFQIAPAQLKGLKNIVLQYRQEPPIAVALPAAAPEPRPPLDPRDPKTPLGIGAKTVSISGAMYDSVVVVKYLDKPLPFTLDKDAKKIVIQLPDGFAAAAGTQVLEFVFSDKTTARYEVTVGAQ